MVCSWCAQPSDSAYHAACWTAYQQKRSRDAEQRMLRAHAIIRDIRHGKPVDVPAEIEAEYGEYFEGARRRD